MKTIIKYGGAFLLLLVIIYLVGPRPAKFNLNPTVETLQISISDLENYVEKHEKSISNLKKGNEAKIIWADSVGRKTPYSLLYLHGFSASEEEGDPIHKEFAKRYGCNLYLARLQSHGLETGKGLHDLNPENYLESAKKAVEIAHILGDSLIIMATSTGCTFALYLAPDLPRLKGLILYSPNVRVKDPMAALLNNPWGKQIATAVLGGETYTWEGDDSVQAYWTTSYPVDALITMQDLLENTMTTQTFEKVKSPLFMGYFYKNEKEQDQVVSVKKALEMFDQLGVPKNKKVKIPFPEAGHHVIASRHKSADLKSVRKETYKFSDDILKLNAIE